MVRRARAILRGLTRRPPAANRAPEFHNGAALTPP